MPRTVIYIILLAVVVALSVWGWLFITRCPQCKRHGLKETGTWDPATRQRRLRCKHCQFDVWRTGRGGDTWSE